MSQVVCGIAVIVMAATTGKYGTRTEANKAITGMAECH
jgi:hypothetical protein